MSRYSVPENYMFGRPGHGYEDDIVRGLVKARVPFLYEPYSIPYRLKKKSALCLDCGSDNVVDEHPYWPDFVSLDGKIVVEAKGKFTPSMRTKMLSVIEHNPEVEIRMLFMRDNWITKRKKAKYTDWCARNDIPYAVGTQFPKEWARDFRNAQRRVK